MRNKIQTKNKLCKYYFLAGLMGQMFSRLTGFTKDSMKIVNLFRSKERYEPSPETQAIVNAKYQ